MDKKIKAFFAAMGIATALLVPVSASADNSDSKVQVSIDITWDSLEFTYTDGQWDPETHSYKGGGWSDSGGNFTVKNNGNVCVEAKFSYANATGMEEIKGRFSSSELIVPISESRNSKLTLSGKPTEHFESMTVGTITVNVTTDDSGDAGDSTITGWYKDEETGDWYYYDKNGKLVTGWFKDGGNEWYYADEDGKLVRGWFNDGGNDGRYSGDDGNIKKNIRVKAKYVEDIKASKTIQADVVWGEMEFTYSVNGTKTWNAKTHEYDIDTKCEWSAKGNDISVTNHSNAAIDVDFTYQPLDEYSVVKGEFTYDEVTIPTAENKAVDDEILTISTDLTLSGGLSSDVTDLTKVGNVAVTIAEAVK